MILDIGTALTRVSPTAEFILRGEPANEAEFAAQFTALNAEAQALTFAAGQAKLSELVAAEPMRALRVERDARLAETDWWATSDRTMTAEQAAYRQALRDLPATTPDPSNPAWPVKPGV